MPLKYPAAWKFEGFPHEIPSGANNEFLELIRTIAEGTERPKGIFEDFKSAYGVDSGSSSASWAESDLARAMDAATGNAARYVASFYAGMEAVRERGIDVPPINVVNGILMKWQVPLVVEPPNLFLREGDIEFTPSRPAAYLSSATPFSRGPEIGRGGFGAVYRMTHETQIGEYHYAMKVLEPSSFIQNKERAEARFKREMRVLEKLQHRGIVQLLEAGLDSERKPYILMPYIDGVDLRRAMSGAKPNRVLRVFDEMLQALEFAHSKGVVHRDLKPSNVLVRSSDDQPIILDFGCAYLIDELDDSLTTTLIGTSAYMPIEVHRDPKNRTVKQDVYSCGVLLYEIIMSKLPDPDEYVPVSTHIDGYDGIDQIIQAALAPERRRLQTADAMRARLKNLALE
jgi:predicted Ser/Thr protein kinase